MRATSLASSHLLLWRAAEFYGLEPEALFRQAGLEPEKIKDAKARYSESASTRLLSSIIEASGDPCFGLNVGAFWHPSALHGLGFAWMASRSLEEALDRLVRYFRILITGERLLMEQRGDGHLLSIETPPEYPRAPDVLYDLIFAAVVHMCRLSAGEDFHPAAVMLRRSAPPCADQFAAYFQTTVKFDAGQDAILMPTMALRAELPTANVDIATASDQIVEQYLAEIDRTEVSVRVAAKLVAMLPSGRVSERAIADSLYMSSRSLQRRLKAEGTTFKALLDATRRDLGIRYLKQSNMSIDEITYMLGFSDSSNFSRAFKRWTGSSPTQFRAAA